MSVILPLLFVLFTNCSASACSGQAECIPIIQSTYKAYILADEEGSMIPIKYVLAIAQVESGFRSSALRRVSKTDLNISDYGLFQINEWWVKTLELNPANLMDPVYNTKFALTLLNLYYVKYGYNIEKTIQIFHIGETSYLSGKRAPNYLNAVIRYANIYTNTY